MSNLEEDHYSDEQTIWEIQNQPHVLMRLAENSLTVAESLRNNYFKNTASFVTDLKKVARRAASGTRTPIFNKHIINNPHWSDFNDELVSFIDGGVGQIELSGQIPILLRVGSYAVKTGERNLQEREQFGYYPVILGNLEGGSKERKDFIDIVRITAELLGGLATLDRNPKLSVLMFHGPLVYLMGGYAGHTPFTEGDIDIFLTNYAADEQQAASLKNDFLDEARIHIYPRICPERADEMSSQKLFEPLSWISFLYRRIIALAQSRSPVPIIMGVVERGRLKEYSEKIILERVFRGLRENNKVNYFNDLYGRRDLTSPKAILDKLNYNDALLLSMLMEPGIYSEPWTISKYNGLHTGNMVLLGETSKNNVDWSKLRPSENQNADERNPNIGFPEITGTYLSVSKTTEPIRIEFFSQLNHEQLEQGVSRAYLYSRLLPGYGFPVGLDIADKYAKVPQWLTNAYGKLIRDHLAISLQRGEISDAEMRRLLVQAIYVTHRDWLYRPNSR